MKIGIKKVARTIAFIFALCATGGAWAAAPVPVAEWSGDLADASVKNTKYTMSMDPGDSSVVSFDNGNAILTSSKSVSSKGVQIAWPDPATDDASFTSRKMSVILQYSSLSILNGNTSLLSALWGDTATEYMVRTSSNNGTAGIATSVKSGATSAGTQYGPSSNFRAPTQGKLLVCFSGDSSHLPGIDLYFSTYDSTTATYGDYQRVSYWSGQKVDNGTFYGLKIGGTIANTSKYYRPGMTVEAVQIYDTVVSASSTAISANTSWSSLVWDHDVFDVVPASLYTYIINVSESATLDLSNATIPTAEKVLINVAADKTLTLTGTPTSSGAPIEIAGSGKVVLSSDPGCNVVVASGATLDISASTVSSAITNNGTVNANGCAFTGAVSNSGTLNTSGTVSFSSSASNSSSGTFNVLSGTTTYNSSSEKAISGTLNVDAKATFVNDKGDSILWDGTVHVHIRGIVTMNAKWTIGANNYIHLYDGALVNGSAGNAFHFNSGEGKIIAETGSSTITAPFVKGNGTIAKSGSGTLRLENQRLPSIKGSEGTIEVVSTESHVDSKHSHTDSNIPFSGTVKFITSSSPSGQYHMLLWSNSATAGMFANRPALDVSGEVRLYDKIATYPLAVRNLCGTGTIRMGGGTSVSGYRYIDTSQTANTVFDGMFTTLNSTYAAYDSALTVRGAVDATETYSLTLTGANTTTGPLVIENNAKVIFSSTGSWAGGTVTVKNGGVLESQNSESIADRLVVQEGATLKFANGVPLAATEYDWSGVSNDQSVNVDLSGIAPSAMPVTLIASDVMIDAAKFKVSASQRTATLSVENGALKATFANFWTDGVWGAAPVANDSATLVLSQNSTLSVSEALTLGDITVVNTSGGEVTLTVSGAGALTTDGWTIPAGVTVVTADGMEIAGDVTGGGVINVPANTTLTMDGVTCSAKVTVEGTLRTTGTTNLSAANTSAANSLIEVVSDTTTLASKVSGIEGNITIAYGAELVAGKCWAPNDEDWYLEPIKPTGTTILDISGTLTLNTYIWYFGAGTTINLRSGASISGTGRSANYGNLSWTGNGTLNCYANTTINAAIRTKADVSPVFNVADGVTLTIASAFVPQTSTADNFTGSGSLTKAGAGTLCLKNVAMTKPISGSEGTLQLLSDASGGKTHTATSSFSGKVIITRNSGGGHHEIGTTANDDSNPGVFFLSGSPELEINGSAAYLCLNRSFAGKYMMVKNLSATSGTIDAKYTTGGTSKTIKCLQTDDTTYAGNFNGEGTTARYVDLLVYGQNETVKTLTLSGASDTMNSYGTLTVKDYGKVKFSGSGDWAAGTVVVGANGYLESSSSAATLASTLTLQDGATVTFVPNKMVTVTTLNLPSGEGETVTFDINYVPALEGTTLISSSSITANTDVGMIQCENAIIKAEEEAIKAYPVATVTTFGSDAVVAYSSVQDAIDNASVEKSQYVTAYQSETVTATGQILLKIDGGAVVTLNSSKAGYAYDDGTPIVDGIYMFSDNVQVAATFKWKTAVASGSWMATENWTSDDGNVSRMPGRLDTVIFESAALVVTPVGGFSFAALQANASVTIKRDSVAIDDRLTRTVSAYGAISGTGSLTLNDGVNLANASGASLSIGVPVTVAGATALTVAEGVAASFTGSGTLTLDALTSTSIVGDDWTGTVVLPAIESGAIIFNNYGTTRSTVHLTSMSSLACINVNNTTINPKLYLEGNMTLSSMSPKSYTFAEIDGPGDLSFASSADSQPIAINITKVAEGYSGTISSTLTTSVTIGKRNLSTLPACDDKVLAVGGTGPISLDVSNIKIGVNEESLPAKYKLERRHVGEEGDGFYVYYNGTIFSVY